MLGWVHWNLMKGSCFSLRQDLIQAQEHTKTHVFFSKKAKFLIWPPESSRGLGLFFGLFFCWSNKRGVHNLYPAIRLEVFYICWIYTSHQILLRDYEAHHCPLFQGGGWHWGVSFNSHDYTSVYWNYPPSQDAGSWPSGWHVSFLGDRASQPKPLFAWHAGWGVDPIYTPSIPFHDRLPWNPSLTKNIAGMRGYPET